MRPASTWSYQSSPFSDVGDRTLARYSSNHRGKVDLSAGQKRLNFAFQAKGVRLGIDRLREVYPSQYAFSQIPTASYMNSDAIGDDYFEDSNTIQRKERPNLFPQQQTSSGDKSYAERKRRFYAMQPFPSRESILSKLTRPGASIRANRKIINRYQHPPQFSKLQCGIAPRGNVIKRNQAMLPGTDSGKWNLSNSFYVDSFEGSSRYNNTPNEMEQRNIYRLNRYHQSDTFENPIKSRRAPTAVAISETDNNNGASQTIDSIYSFDGSQQNETFDRAFKQNYSYRFQHYPRR